MRRFLLPLGWLYLIITKLRRKLYDYGILSSKKLPSKVISVGNISAGGTGKTTLTIALAKLLRGQGDRVAIILRGYKRKKRDEILIVSDGNRIFASVEESGDEAYMIAKKLKDVAVIVGKDRFRAGSEAIKLGANTLILDDGFQYLKLFKDFEIVVIDAMQPFGKDAILPVGRLRESIKTIKRASSVLITRSNQTETESLKGLKEEISKIAPNLPLLESIHQTKSLRYSGSSKEVELKAVEGKRVIAVCGIGNPMAFLKTVQSLNPAEVKATFFPDHHTYSEKELKAIIQEAKELKADLIITTEKDEHKIRVALPVMVLCVELAITSGQRELDNFIMKIKN